LNTLKSFIKILCLALVLVITLSCVLSCAREVQNIPTETDLNGGAGVLANNSAVDFYFYYPENWGIDRNDTMITIYTNAADVISSDIRETSTGEHIDIMTRPNISATSHDLSYGRYATAEEYWNELAFPSFERFFDNIEKDADVNLTVAGIEAKKYTFTFSAAGMDYKIAQIIFLNKSRVYILTYTAALGKYQEFAHVLNTVTETFEFK